MRAKSIGRPASSAQTAPTTSSRSPARSLGAAFFANVPSTLRQGVEAEANFHNGNLSAYVKYAFVDATYQFSQFLASPNNPLANADGNVFVTPGDHIPGIPRHLVKFGGDYGFTPKFKLGADVLIAGAQYFVGDFTGSLICTRPISSTSMCSVLDSSTIFLTTETRPLALSLVRHRCAECDANRFHYQSAHGHTAPADLLLWRRKSNILVWDRALAIGYLWDTLI
jgi:TonB dependent receptor